MFLDEEDIQNSSSRTTLWLSKPKTMNQRRFKMHELSSSYASFRFWPIPWHESSTNMSYQNSWLSLCYNFRTMQAAQNYTANLRSKSLSFTKNKDTHFNCQTEDMHHPWMMLVSQFELVVKVKCILHNPTYGKVWIRSNLPGDHSLP